MPIQFSIRTMYKVLGTIGVLGGAVSCTLIIVLSLNNGSYIVNHIVNFVSSLVTIFIGLYLIHRASQVEDRQIGLCVPIATPLP